MKEIKLKLIKIKRHSNDFWKNRVNILVKEELSLNKILQIEDVNIDNLKVLPR